jgi:hypothetical protein
VIFVGGAGQLDSVFKLLGIPLLPNANVIGVKTEFPGTSQWDRIICRSGICANNKEQCEQERLEKILSHKIPLF